MIVELEPYPAMKPSYVEWLGDVPEPWNVRLLKRRLKRLCTHAALYAANMAATFHTLTGIRFLRTSDIRRRYCLAATMKAPSGRYWSIMDSLG